MPGYSERVVSRWNQTTLPHDYCEFWGVKPGQTVMDCFYNELVIFVPKNLKLTPRKQRALQILLK